MCLMLYTYGQVKHPNLKYKGPSSTIRALAQVGQNINIFTQNDISRNYNTTNAQYKKRTHITPPNPSRSPQRTGSKCLKGNKYINTFKRLYALYVLYVHSCKLNVTDE
jgi:hypothetical protein